LPRPLAVEVTADNGELDDPPDEPDAPDSVEVNPPTAPRRVSTAPEAVLPTTGSCDAT
jgi:hypothetical protein